MAAVRHALLVVLAALLCAAALGKKHKLNSARVKDVSKSAGAKAGLAGKADQIRGGRDESDRDEHGDSAKKVSQRGNAVRMQQKYKGVKVFGYQSNDILVEGRTERKSVDKDGPGQVDVVVPAGRIQTGKFVAHLDGDFPTVNHGRLMHMVIVAKREMRKRCRGTKISLLRGEPIVYVDEDTEEGSLGVHVSLFCEPHGAHAADEEPEAPNGIFDDEGELIKEWNDLRTGYEHTGTGYGGNVRTGRYRYGGGKDKFAVNNVGGVCSMETDDYRTLWWSVSETQAHQFTCGTDQMADPINGAHSALNDVHYGAGRTFAMFADWYDTKPFLHMPLQMRVHYDYPYFNAFYSGDTGKYSFGDGSSVGYPPVTLDVVAHELGHGAVEYAAGLIYDSQSGGLNEAFADMTAMAVLRHGDETPTWKVGEGIFKDSSRQALRHMDSPTSDGLSIAHISQYAVGMDVHHSSGVFNKLFYELSRSLDYGVWDAYDLMYYAMTVHWTRTTNFVQAAEGLLTTLDQLRSGEIDTPDTYSWIGAPQLTAALDTVGILCDRDAGGWTCRQ